MTARISPLKGKARDDYLDLVLKFPLTSIKSEEQLQDAQAVMDGLLAMEKLSVGQEMYLDALSDLVAAYEDARGRPDLKPPCIFRAFVLSGFRDS